MTDRTDRTDRIDRRGREVRADIVNQTAPRPLVVAVMTVLEDLAVKRGLSGRLHVGVTGTREGMTDEQVVAFQVVFRLINSLFPVQTWHHGDCVGVDSEIHDGVRGYTVMKTAKGDLEYARGENARIRIAVHPPEDQRLRGFRLNDADEVRQPKTHLARNRDIVDESELLLACPMQMEHQKRGGTWYTHDYAVKLTRGKQKTTPVLILFPDGKVSAVLTNQYLKGE